MACGVYGGCSGDPSGLSGYYMVTCNCERLYSMRQVVPSRALSPPPLSSSSRALTSNNYTRSVVTCDISPFSYLKCDAYKPR